MQYSDVDLAIIRHLLDHVYRSVGGRNYEILSGDRNSHPGVYRDHNQGPCVTIKGWLAIATDHGTVTMVQYLPYRRWVFDLRDPGSLEATEAAIDESVRLLISSWLAVKLLAASVVLIAVLLALYAIARTT